MPMKNDQDDKININIIIDLEEEVEFYKSLFKTHSNSCIFNLHIKKINGEKVWIDNVREHHKIHLLDMDDEVKEWLKPIKCER